MAIPGWQKARRRMMSRLGVNAVAKIWIRSKFLRDFKKWYLQRKKSVSSNRFRALGDRMIRLLQLRPGYCLNTIKCDSIHVSLDSAGDYGALSYTWQHQTPTVPILVDEQMVLVSENLYLALIHLRKRGVERIWVDALCINQSDRQELASQVYQMKAVYQQASIVLVWLGDSNDSSRLAFDALHGMVEHLDWQGRVPASVFDSVRMSRNPKKWTSISELFCRSWFRRTWVIQEVLAARQAMLLCGADALSMDLFLKIIYSMMFSNALRPIMAYHPDRYQLSEGPMKATIKQLEFLVTAKIRETKLLSSCDFKSSLLNLLIETRWAEVTDPRDKVYGILSLAEDARALGYMDTNGNWIPFHPDYSLSTKQVFTNVTKAIICGTRSLEVLRFAGKRKYSDKNLASWVPDWANEAPHNVHNYTSVVSDRQRERKSWRDNSEDSDTPVHWCPIHENITLLCSPSFVLGNSDALILKGIHADTITTVSKREWPFDEGICNIDSSSEMRRTQKEMLEGVEHQLQLLHQWVDNCGKEAEKCSPYPTGERPCDALWRVLSGKANVEKPPEDLACEGHLSNIRDAQSDLAFFKEIYALMRPNDTDAMLETAMAAAVSRIEDHFSRLGKTASVCSSKSMPQLGRNIWV